MEFPFKVHKLDLSKAKEHNHPDIKIGRKYLCKVQGKWIIGSFSKQWYGLNFNWFWSAVAGLQFDSPGTNHSTWEEIWEIKGQKENLAKEFVEMVIAGQERDEDE